MSDRVHGGADAAEAAFEGGAAGREAEGAAGAQRSGPGGQAPAGADRRFTRVLRDRAILAQQLAETQAALSAVHAARAKDRADGFGAEMTRAEREVVEAVTGGDAEAVARANRRIAEVAASRTAATLQAEQAAADAASEAARAKRPAQRAQGEVSDVTAAWMAANPWYGKDDRMTRQALVLHEEALEDGLPPDSREYWQHINVGVRARFGDGSVRDPRAAAGGDGSRARGGDEARGADGSEEFVVEEPREPRDPGVAARVPVSAGSGVPASRNGAGGGAVNGTNGAAGTMRISADAVAIAKAMGISPQKYAARAAALVHQGRISRNNIAGGS